MTVDSRTLHDADTEGSRGRHFDRKAEEGMDRDDGREQDRRATARDVSPVGLTEEARDMRNAGRRLDAQWQDPDVIGVAEKLMQAVERQEANNRQLAKDMGNVLQQLREVVTEVERIRSDARDESHTAQQAALSGVNRAQQEAEQLTLRNIDKVTKKSTEYIDSMVQVAKRRIERLALITLPDKLFNTLKWVVLILALFVLSQMAVRMIAA